MDRKIEDGGKTTETTSLYYTFWYTIVKFNYFVKTRIL